jgi:mannose-6-phosphate isomerase
MPHTISTALRGDAPRLDAPLKLAPDNWTPPTRTPWGGRRIWTDYKRHLPALAGREPPAALGESWEVSVDPAFPSDLLLSAQAGGTERLSLAEALRRWPTQWLGAQAVAAGDVSTPMLVKLLDAADALSVQVHPDDAYAGLGPDASGKPECWYILGAAPGAGLYLGLAEGVTRPALAQALRGGDDLTPMLNFVPVRGGDMFMIGPGTVHAIGAGVTLVEPQLVWPGKSGQTYRFWDWNRRYDAHGHLDLARGQPRPLHIDHSLAVTRFDGPRGAAFVDACRAVAQPLQRSGDAAHDRLGALGQMEVERLRGSGVIALPDRDTLCAAVVTRGHTVWAAADAAPVEAQRGESLVLPAAARGSEVRLRDAEVILTWMRPR